MKQPQLTVVILNTNRRDDTLSCLASLAGNDYPNLHTIVLDNHSSDGSVDAIRSEFPQTAIIELEENLGYAGNNNVGIQAALDAGADWVLVLNEDTLLAPDCLSQLIAAAHDDKAVGIAGPLVYHHSEPQVIQSAGGQLDRHWSTRHLAQNVIDHGQFTRPRKVDWISGCAIMVRRQVVEEIGALDDRFFYYWEETEWCLRAARAGWDVLLVPQARLWHKGVQRNYEPSPSVTYYNTRNRFLMMAKHKAPLRAWVAVGAQSLRTLFSWSVRPKWRSKRQHRDAALQGIGDFLRRRWGIRVE